MRVENGEQMQLDDTANILAEATFFDVCDAEQRRLLAFAAERKKYRPGSIIYASGDVPEGAHVLISGTVATTQDSAPNDPVVQHVAGTLIGLSSLVLAKPRPLTIKAVDTVETLMVPRAAFMKLARQYPDLAERAAARLKGELAGFLGTVAEMRGRIRE